MKKISVLVAVVLLSVAGCSNFLSSSTVYRQAIYTDTGVHEPDDFPVLRATGYALISEQRGPSASQRTLQAMRASKLDAYRELTEQVYGVYIRGGSAQQRSVERTEHLSAEVEGIIQGARVLRQYPLADSYVTELELDTKVLYDLYQLRGAL